jgi:nitrous oxidase accessory protein
MKKHSTLLLLTILISATLITATFPFVKAASATIIVPNDYTTIQAAINNSADGDTIFVRKGIYRENPIVNKSISLTGENCSSTTIEISNSLRIQKENATVTGFTIKGKGGDGILGGTGISLEASYCNISGNKVTEVTHGMIMFESNNSCITGNVFENIGSSSAIQLNFANWNLVSNNYIDSCVEGIQIWQNSNNNTVTENTIKYCQDVAIRFQYSDDNTIVGNNISLSGYGTTIYGSNRNTISNNNYVYNTVQFDASETYYLTFGYNRSVNTINGNYWSDYNGTDNNGDGIGDKPYIIDANNKDNNPLLKQTSTLNQLIPTPSPTNTPTSFSIPNPNTTNPTSSQTPNPTPSLTTPNSPSHQPTLSPSSPPPNDNVDGTNSPLLEIGIIVFIVAAFLASIVVYFIKKR